MVLLIVSNGRGILKVFDQVRSTRPDAKRRAVFHVTKTEKEIEAKTDRIYVAPEVIFMLRDYKLVQISINSLQETATLMMI